MLPTGDILDFIDDEGFSLAENLDHDLVKVVGIFSLETEETVILEVDVVEGILAESVRHLSQQGGFSNPPQAGDDHGMGDIRGPFNFNELGALDTSLALPKGIELLQEHGLDLVF